MTHRGWILKEPEIEEEEAGMNFTKGQEKVEIEIEREQGRFKVLIKSTYED